MISDCDSRTISRSGVLGLAPCHHGKDKVEVENAGTQSWSDSASAPLACVCTMAARPLHLEKKKSSRSFYRLFRGLTHAHTHTHVTSALSSSTLQRHPPATPACPLQSLAYMCIVFFAGQILASWPFQSFSTTRYIYYIYIYALHTIY